MSPKIVEEESAGRWSETQLEVPLRLPGHDGRTIRVVSGRGYRYVLPFPYKLHEMLEEVEKAGGDFIVAWLPGGKAFRVQEIDQFVKKIVPLYFKQRQYKSFQRQLHLYGFQRVSEGLEKGAYYHKYFVREERHLCHQMIRKMNVAEKKAHQAKGIEQSKGVQQGKGVQQKKPKGNLVESFAPSSSLGLDPALDTFNDSVDYKRPEIRFSSGKIEPAASSMPNSQHMKYNQHQRVPRGAASMPNVMQMTNGAPVQQGDNIAGTINWLLSEGVSLADLGSVLNMPNGQQNSQPRSMPMHQLPMPQAAPQEPVSNSSNQSPADFAEDVISLFGKPCPPSEISFTNHQVNNQQPMNNNPRKQAEEYSDELYRSIFFGQNSFLTHTESV